MQGFQHSLFQLVQENVGRILRHPRQKPVLSIYMTKKRKNRGKSLLDVKCYQAPDRFIVGETPLNKSKEHGKELQICSIRLHVSSRFENFVISSHAETWSDGQV